MRSLILLLVLALGMTGCRHHATAPDTKLQVESGEIDVQRLAQWADEQTGAEVFAAWLAAIGQQTNSTELLTAYAVAADEQIVEYLSKQSRGDLLGYLDSLKRRKNRHHYTQGQLERALEIKDQPRKTRAKPLES